MIGNGRELSYFLVLNYHNNGYVSSLEFKEILIILRFMIFSKFTRRTLL